MGTSLCFIFNYIIFLSHHYPFLPFFLITSPERISLNNLPSLSILSLTPLTYTHKYNVEQTLVTSCVNSPDINPQGSSAGEACAFRISSLNKLVMTKSNNPRLTLLHVLVEEAQRKDQRALAFVDDLLEDLQKASR